VVRFFAQCFFPGKSCLVFLLLQCHLPDVLWPFRTTSYYYPPTTLSPDNCWQMPSICPLPLANCLLFLPPYWSHAWICPPVTVLTCSPLHDLLPGHKQPGPFCPSYCLLPADFLCYSIHLMHTQGHLPAACSTCPWAV
jgi:hypothetical protein